MPSNPAPPAAGHLTRVGRVMITVADQDAALAFYRDVLGFAVLADIPFGDGHRWLEVGLPGAETALALNPPAHGLTPGCTTGVSFETSDAGALHAHLLAAGVKADPEVTRIGGPVPPRFAFWDPDDNAFDVAEAG